MDELTSAHRLTPRVPNNKSTKHDCGRDSLRNDKKKKSPNKILEHLFKGLEKSLKSETIVKRKWVLAC